MRESYPKTCLLRIKNASLNENVNVTKATFLLYIRAGTLNLNVRYHSTEMSSNLDNSIVIYFIYGNRLLDDIDFYHKSALLSRLLDHLRFWKRSINISIEKNKFLFTYDTLLRKIFCIYSYNLC